MISGRKEILKMKDKYNLTREQNVFLAKKVMTSSVYNAAKLEGLNITYVQTEKILNGINDGNVSLDDVRVILNLKSAWKYILDNLDKDLDVDFICNVNKRTSNIVANAILISNGKGILNIEEKDLEEYNIKLSEYYLSGDNRKMLKFLYDNAIEGIQIDKKIEIENKRKLQVDQINKKILQKDRKEL